MTRKPIVDKDSFWGDFLNALFMRRVYRDPVPATASKPAEVSEQPETPEPPKTSNPPDSSQGGLDTGLFHLKIPFDKPASQASSFSANRLLFLPKDFHTWSSIKPTTLTESELHEAIINIWRSPYLNRDRLTYKPAVSDYIQRSAGSMFPRYVPDLSTGMSKWLAEQAAKNENDSDEAKTQAEDTDVGYETGGEASSGDVDSAQDSPTSKRGWDEI